MIAKGLFKNGDFIKAIEHFTKALRLNPRQENLYHLRGLTYLKVGQNELAIHDFNKALKIDPKQVVFYSDRGKAYIELGNYWKAILDYSRAIEIHPRTADRYYDRGHAYQKSGNYLKSIDDYSNAIRLDTKHAQAYLGRGEAYLITGKAIESINDFSKAIEHSQNWAIAYFNRGLSYQRKGYDTLALQDYKSANRIEPDNRKFKEAIQNIESSIDDSKIKPDKKLNIIVQDKSEIKEPSQLFVPITQEKSRQLLLAIEHLPGLGGSIVTPEGINTISTLNEMFDIFNTAYYLLTVQLETKNIYADTVSTTCQGYWYTSTSRLPCLLL